MKLTSFTKSVLHHRKTTRHLKNLGYMEIDLHGTLEKMGLYDRKITEVVVGHDGESVFIKTEQKESYRSDWMLVGKQIGDAIKQRKPHG